MSDLVKQPTLAEYALEVERMCDVIDNHDGELPQDLIAKFAETTQDLSNKVDNWLGFLDATKARIELLKEHRERVTKAVKGAEKFQDGLKGYLKHVMQTFPDVPYKGSTGRLRLQNNPESVKIDFDTKDVTVYRTIEKALIDLEPSLNAYVKEIRLYIVEADKLKSDLKAGMQLPWARLSRDQHVRISQ